MNWDSKPLADVCELRPPKAEARKKLNPCDDVSFVPMSDLSDSTMYFESRQTRSLSDVEGSYTYFADGDVLLAKITPCFENGKLGVARNLKNGIGFGSSEYFVIRASDRLVPQFLYYLLARKSFLEEGANVMTGAVGHRRVPKEFIESYPVPLPALDEQKRIVAILDEAFKGIAKATANAERNLANARELFYAFRKALIEGAALAFKPIGELCENLDSQRKPITKRDRKAGDIPYYGASGIVDHVADWIFDEELLLVSEDGANLLMRTYPIAFPVKGKCWINNHAHVLRFASRPQQKLIEYYLNSIRLEPWVSGMAQPKLNQKALNSIPVPVASDKRCIALIERLDLIAEGVEEASVAYNQKLERCEELKQSLLHKAFSGELTSATERAA